MENIDPSERPRRLVVRYLENRNLAHGKSTGDLRYPIRAGLKAAMLGLLMLPCLSGCQLLGYAAAILPPPTIPAKYTDLRGQSVAVMVWVTPGVRLNGRRCSSI